MTPSLRWLWLSLLVLILDQASKTLATALLDYGQPLAILPVFDLTLLHNYGAAFSFLADHSGWQRWFFAIIAVAISVYLLIWLRNTPANQKLLCLSLALVLGGAIGNLVDRIWLGYVVDFISVHWQQWYYPAFNIADSAICVGAVLLIWDMFMSNKQESSA